MTESAKPPTPPSDTGPLPTDEEAIRAAVSALAARLSPVGPPRETATKAGSVTLAPAAARAATSDAPVTVIPGRAAPPPAPVEPPPPSPREAARQAVARTIATQPPPSRRRHPGRLVAALLLLLLLIGGGVWLMRDHPQVAALLDGIGIPAGEPKQATAPPSPPVQAPLPPAEAKPASPPPPAEAKPGTPPPAPPAQASEPAPAATPPPPATPSAPEPQRVDVPLAPEPPPVDIAPPKAADAAAVPPTFDNVFVRDGRAVVSGRAPAGARVEVQVDGRTVATVEADARGEWVAILDAPLPPGGHEVRLVQTPPGGAPVSSDRTVAVVIPAPAAPPPLAAAPPVAPAPPAEAAKPDAAAPPPPPPAATSAPAAPLVVATPTAPGGASQVLQSPPLARAGDLVLGTVDYDELGRMTISGQANPGETVRVYLSNEAIGSAVAGADGKWTLSPARPTPHGPQRLRVDRLTAGGPGVAHRLEVPFERMKAKPGDSVTVVWGDNLWNIARGSLGGGERYTAIYQANRNQIRDPNLIYPGQVFVIPKPR